MEKKIDILRKMAEEGKWIDAIKFAAKFPRLGKDKVAITRAKDCIVNPRFYISLGYDPEKEIQLGIAALRARYNF